MKQLVRFSLCCLLAQGVFAQRHGGGVAVSGRHGDHGGGHGNVRFGGNRYGGYGYGGLFGDYYEPFSNFGYSQGYNQALSPSNVTIVYPPAAPQAMVTQTAHPVIHEYNRPEDYGTSPEGENHPILYLIAFRDRNIRAASTYWVEDGTLHYLGADHRANQAPLASVDRDLSAQLNRERHVPFNLQ